ncbi:hypothetical protein [Paenarthrobacter sp. AB444]|uniref:hypothetical protein n=1 Tax=Paenarthrobacter sp. AB444 TaxID=3025681 RepID=UPI002365D217|nr:hypothetical protein [Paenarthrobacter sp. AB444]MDD7833893.1 hypothetical protein [Paenarthrobacter sp. AB444]
MATRVDVDLTSMQWHADPADDYFGAPFIDQSEWHESPVPHHYVHGGFTGTDTRFSFYLPEETAYEGRFYQHVTPVPQSENLATQEGEAGYDLAFFLGTGAYFIETNGGGPNAANPFSGLDPLIGAYRANAAAAKFSRLVAAALYGDHRPYGYLFGGSGGAYRTLGASENTEGVWDGFVPFVPGSPMSIPNVFSVRMHAHRILRDVFPEIVDAYDVGGDPSSLRLTEEQSAALQEVTRMGFPPRSWFGWKTMGMHGFSVLYPGVMAADPTYANDFWTIDGYLGADPRSSVHRDRLQLKTTIEELLSTSANKGEVQNGGGVDESFLALGGTAHSVTALRFADDAQGWFLGAQLTVTSGDHAGATIRLAQVTGRIAEVEPNQAEIIAKLEVGDQVLIDNSNFLAAQTYHRHQVPDSEYTVWDQFKSESGEPLYPQRPMLVGPLFAKGAAGTVPTGNVSGKVITVAALLDREAFPWQADWLRRRVENHLGDDAENRFRIWYIDNAVHGDAAEQEFADRTVSYLGALELALVQLAAWVERGIEPSPNSVYEIADGQVAVPARVEDRGGIQPVAVLLADGVPSVEARVGESVSFTLEATAPTGSCIVEVVPVEDGVLQEALPIEPGLHVTVGLERTYAAPGTYFLAARIAAQPESYADSPNCRVLNIVRARVTVKE